MISCLLATTVPEDPHLAVLQAMMPIINIYNMACIVQAEKKENFWRQRKEGMTEEREDSPVQVGWLALSTRGGHNVPLLHHPYHS